MKWSITVAEIAGTRVRIHITFLLFLAWVGTSIWKEGGASQAIAGVAFISTVFLCVLLHEFGHAFAARRYGIATPKITLLPFGGVASLERIPVKPTEELVISIAGPAVNLVLAALFWVLGNIVPALSFPLQIPGLEGGFADQLIRINLILLLFNLLPAFPMDGGRIFRALLAMFLPRSRATTYAVRTGQALALLGGAFALAASLPILFLVAVFVFFVAEAEASQSKNSELLAGFRAADAAMTNFLTLSPQNTIEEATRLLLDGSQTDFPVVDAEGHCLGILTRQHLIGALSKGNKKQAVGDFTNAAPPVIAMNTPIIEAWQALTASKFPSVPITDTKGKIAGWLTVENLAEFLLTREAITISKH